MILRFAAGASTETRKSAQQKVSGYGSLDFGSGSAQVTRSWRQQVSARCAAKIPSSKASPFACHVMEISAPRHNAATR
ncbi:hypothetical protein [Sphingomonas immobilis]|uniref:Uncharacterized protein n=1 Tax=Sphingomonas immobilis TaxID=3063997 RepID=A0ABT8ZU14_9SPHN|nr:hypothetical protein [Sphingomonas sp. CA1-15]MDO7841058.1 hypothetical protein [Sphingomonas sp. CA1-15]